MKSNWLERLIKNLPKEIIGSKEIKQLIRFLRREYKKELANPPRIAVLGRAGVGKSSTINSLFGTNLRVGHSRTGTSVPLEMLVKSEPKHVKGRKGDLIIYDMPGVGEDIDNDERYKQFYREVIAKCDVAVWILAVEDRSIAYDQAIIRDVLRQANERVSSRLVIGVNKVDLIHPVNWNKKWNLPSREQETYLHDRLEDIQTKLRKVSPNLNRDHIIGYSATKRYHLSQLFSAMMDACTKERAWVLANRKDIAKQLELVSPESRKQLRADIRG